MEKITAGLVLYFALLNSAEAQVRNFKEAKRVLLQRVYVQDDERRTFYCGCQFDSWKRIDASTCGYRIYRDAARGIRVEWEHIVPASAFGTHLPCWRNARAACGRKGGRQCCGRVNDQFRKLEADMHNLVPAVGELNAERENYRFGIVPGEARRFGACDFEVSGGVAEPRPQVRGDIARAYFYMDDRARELIGRGVMSRQEALMFVEWDKADPPDRFECVRNERIRRLQGNDNPYVTAGCR